MIIFKSAKLLEGVKVREKKHLVTYQNEFIDSVIFSKDYTKKMLHLFFAIVYKVQENSSLVEFDKDEIKNLIKTSNMTNKEFSKLLINVSSKAVLYKTDEEITIEDKVIAKKGDYVHENFFERLIEQQDSNRIVIQIKPRFKSWFFDFKTNKIGFSKHYIEDVKSLDSKPSITLFTMLNRWRTFKKSVFMDFEYVKKNLNVSSGYKNNDVLRLLEKCKIDIEGKTDLRFNFSVVRNQNGRKIEQIIFNVNNEQSKLEELLGEEYTNSTQLSAIKVILKQKSAEKLEELFNDAGVNEIYKLVIKEILKKDFGREVI